MSEFKSDLIAHSLSEPSEMEWFKEQARNFVRFISAGCRSQHFAEVLITARQRYNLQAHVFEHIRALSESGEMPAKEAVKQVRRACSVFESLFLADILLAKKRLKKCRAKYLQEGRAGWLSYFAITHGHREIGGRDDVSWFRAACDKHATLRWDSSACLEMSVPLPPKPLPGRLTRSQRDVIKSLGQVWGLLRDRQVFAGVRIREKMLIAAPTGSGKSHCVKEFARVRSLPLLELEPAAWVPVGARYERYTGSDIQAFVKQHDSGVIFLDETDKLVVSSDYMTGVRQEIYSLLDGATRGFTMMSDKEKDKLRRRFLIIGAGTWQELFSARSLGFKTQRSPLTIDRQDKIPEELLRRFGHIFYLQPPGEDEFEKWIQDLYCELLLPLPDVKRLAREAVESQMNCRWMENHLTYLLCDPAILEQHREAVLRRRSAAKRSDAPQANVRAQTNLPF